jgi:uncharacterized protein
VAAPDLPLPRIDALSEPFWRHARGHRLAVQRCTACGHHQFPPSPVCARCLDEGLEWHAVSGHGTLLSWADFYKAYWPGFAGRLPYRVCVVELDEGPLLVATLDSALPQTLRTGARVQARFDDVTPEISLLRFRITAPQR